MPVEHLDVLIVGAGLSGICAARYLQKRCPHHSYAIVEGRERIGGTWDLFRYPGVRSDSDMHTFGYSFEPWTRRQTIAAGADILEYLETTARRHDIAQQIRFQHRVRRASWSTSAARWLVELEIGPNREVVHLSCGFLLMCSGYYRYEHGYMPQLPGAERFKGRIVHPQQWSDSIDYAQRRVIVIGSGATAITLVPELAKRAASVILLQRSPSYVISQPKRDQVARVLARMLPVALVHRLMRWKGLWLGMLSYSLSRRYPDQARRILMSRVRQALGPDFDVDTHFNPRYSPWDQRLCVAADGDLFATLKSECAAIVTGEIDTFTETGVRLRSGQELQADIIVTATGLDMQVVGGVQVDVDGTAIDFAKALIYKGSMYSDVPNLVWITGYTHAAWTLKCELTCDYVCRLLNYMHSRGHRQCTPRQQERQRLLRQLDFSPGYILRARSKLPKQGASYPWKLRQHYALDWLSLRCSPLRDTFMEFSNDT